MKKLLYVSGCALFLAVALCACKKVEIPGSINGYITDKATGEPVKTAGVELLPIGQKYLTGSEGQFEFNDIEPGTYKLHVTKTGYEELMSNEFVVKSDKVTQCLVQLEKLPPSLRIVNDKTEDIDSLDFGAEEDDVMRSFNIFNDGIVFLQWEIAYTAEWITGVSKENGVLEEGETQNINLTIDRGKLEDGENVTTVYITSNSGNKQLKVIAIGSNL